MGFAKPKPGGFPCGDKNTRFFHQTTLTRRRKNKVIAFQAENEGWKYEDDAIRAPIMQFYSSLYSFEWCSKY